MGNEVKLDEIGYWSEVKLDIVREYASTYSRILANQKFDNGQPRFKHMYIDAFAGAGLHVSKNTDEFVLGSPINALQVDPPFTRCHFIDLDGDRVAGLRANELVKERGAVVHEGNCNEILVDCLLPAFTYKSFCKALLVLDPYGINLNWDVVRMAGELGTVEVFLNFMVMDMNRTVFWRDWKRVDEQRVERMNRFWGEESWMEVVYERELDLFGDEIVTKRAGNEPIVEAYKDRLKKVAGFKYVPEPVPMKNEQGAIVYYLFFASQKPVAAEIVAKIFDKYRERAAAGS